MESKPLLNLSLKLSDDLFNDSPHASALEKYGVLFATDFLDLD